MTRRTIHNMTDADVMMLLVDVAGPRKAIQWGMVTERARRLAGPDPRPLAEALKRIEAFPSNIEHRDMTFSEAVAAMAEHARAALEAWENGQ